MVKKSGNSDITFVASVFTGALATFGLSTGNSKDKGNNTRQLSYGKEKGRMNKWLLLFLLASPMVARAELVTPQFTQGSMNSTTTTQQDIEEDITITKYGSVLIKMDWREYYTYFSNIWRNSRFRFSIHDSYSRRSIHSRNNNKSSNSSTRNTGNRKNYRNYCYYYLALCLLSIAPVYAEPEVQNTSNPVAAATGNVTNQAVQFQNNGAPSRQILGPNISCNGVR